MRRLPLLFLTLPLLLAAGPCGTDGCGSTTQNITNVNVGPAGPSGPLTPAPIDFRCQRAGCTGAGPSCSSIACTWAGGGVFDLCAQDVTLGRFCVHSSSPAEIDPGSPGAGKGTWRPTLEQGGVTLAQAPEVPTDS